MPASPAPAMSSEPRFDRALRAIVDTPARSLLVSGLSRAHQRWPEADLLNRSVESTSDALAEDGAFVTARLKFGPRVLVDSREPDGQQLVFSGELDTPVTRLLERIAFAGWTFIDLGSCTGYFALLARHLGGAGSTVHAFEPDAIHGDHIAEATTRAGDPQGVLVVHARCGARKETQYGIRGAEMVITVDDHCDTHRIAPTAVRIPADGHQLAVLEGARRQLRNQRFSYLLVPNGWRDDSVEVERFLAGYGYLAQQVSTDGELVALDGDPSATLCYRPA